MVLSATYCTCISVSYCLSSGCIPHYREQGAGVFPFAYEGGEPNVALVEVPPDGGTPNATEEEGVHKAAGPPDEEG
jgi:hypothetical protein